MDTLETPQVKKLTETITPEQLEAATRRLTVMDAMRLGSTVTTKADGWGSGDNACALASVRIAAAAVGYCK